MAGTQSTELSLDTLVNAKAALDAANESASYARGLFIAFLALTAYVAVIIAGTTHEQILRETPVTLPLLNVDLPLSGFYRYLPWLYGLLHFNLLLTLVLMAGKVREVLSYRKALTPAGEWRPLSKRLIGFPVVQVLAGEQDGFLHLVLALMIWITLVLVPLWILLWLLIGYLPAQDEGVLAWQRVALTLDAVVLLLLWPRLISGESTLAWWVGNLRGCGHFLRGLGYFLIWLIVILWFDLAYILIRRIRTGHWVTTPTWRHYMGGMIRYLSVLWRGLKRRKSARHPGHDISTKRSITGLLRRLRRPRRHYAETLVLLVSTVLVTAIAWFAAVIPGSGWEERLLATCKRDYNQRLYTDSCRWWPTWMLFDQPQDQARLLRSLNVLEAVLTGEPLEPEKITVFRRDYAGYIDENTLDSIKPFILQNRLLRYANLRNALLPKVDLRWAELQGADLSGARLQGAILSEAELQGASLVSANFQNANLSRTRLQDANLSGARLQGTNLSGAQLQNANFSGAKLQGADLSGARLDGANFSEAELQGADLSGARLQDANLRRAWLEGANLFSAQLQGADLRGAQLQGVNLSAARLQGANLRDSNLSYTYLFGANIDKLSPKDYPELKRHLGPSSERNYTLENIVARPGTLMQEQTLTRIDDVKIEFTKTCLVAEPLANELPDCLVGTAQYGRYLSGVIPFWVDLACEATPAMRGLIRRIMENTGQAASLPEARTSGRDALMRLQACSGFQSLKDAYVNRGFDGTYSKWLQSLLEQIQDATKQAD